MPGTAAPHPQTTQTKPEPLLEVGGGRQTLGRKATRPRCDSKRRTPCSTVCIPPFGSAGASSSASPGDIAEQRTRRGMREKNAISPDKNNPLFYHPSGTAIKLFDRSMQV